MVTCRAVFIDEGDLIMAGNWIFNIRVYLLASLDDYICLF
jgi:hypothetical protein